MRRRIAWSLLAVALFCAGAGSLAAASASVSVELMTSSTESTSSGSSSLMNSYNQDSRWECIYPASVLTEAGVPANKSITALALRMYSVPPGALNNMRIRIKHTTLTKYSTSATYTNSGYTLCYGPTTLTSSSFTAGAWFTFTLSTPFVWDGTSSLMIDFTKDGTSSSGSSGGGFYLRDAGSGNYRTLYSYYYTGGTHSYPFDAGAGYGPYWMYNVPSLKVTYTADTVTQTNAPTLPAVKVGASYGNVDLAAVAGTTPYAWTKTSGTLPTGMTLVQPAGQNYFRLSGTPTQSGTFTFTALVEDASSPKGSHSRTFTLNVEPILITTASPLTKAKQGVAYGPVDIAAQYGTTPYTWSTVSGSIPGGMTLSQPSGTNVYRLQGTPNSVSGGQTFNFTVRVTDANGNKTDKAFALTVDPMAILPTTTDLPMAWEGKAYTAFDIYVQYGVSPYAWSVSSGSIPSGMSLIAGTSTSGAGIYRLAGTPAAGSAGTYNFTVKVTDSVSATATRAYKLVVMPPAKSLPYTEDFETSSGTTSGWSTSWDSGITSGVWEWGTPSTVGPAAAYSGTKCWGTKIAANYPGPKSGSYSYNAYLDTPEFKLAGSINPGLSFAVWYDTEYYYGQCELHVRKNGGTWEPLYGSDAGWVETGGYTTYYGWTGTGSGWQKALIDIDAISTMTINKATDVVQFRFRFFNADSTGYPGVYIDKFKVAEIPDKTKFTVTDFTITSAYKSGSNPKCYTGEQYAYSITLKNNSTKAINVTSATFMVSPAGSSTPENIGTFAGVTVPFTVPASATSYVLTGTFSCTAIASTGDGTTCTCTVVFEGTEATTNIPVEATGEELAGIYKGPPPPPPELEVHELNYTGPKVTSGQSATGTNRDLGSIDIEGGSTPSVWIVLYNKTGASVNVGKPTLGGAAAAQFEVNPNSWGTSSSIAIADGGTASFSVKCNPYTIGLLECTVSFTHNASAPATSPFQVKFICTSTGNAPALQVHEGSYKGVKVSNGQGATGTSRDFGSVAAGAYSQWLNIVIWNRFISNTTINPLPSLTGPDAADFTLSITSLPNPCVIGGSADFTETVYFSVMFSPQATSTSGSKVANVSFGHNASNPATSPFTFEVRGDCTGGGGGGGGGGTANITVNEADASATPWVVGASVANGAVAANERDFGQQVITAGPTSWLGIRVRNTGTVDMTVGVPSLSGSHAGEFALDTAGFAGVVAPGSDRDFKIRFDPSSAGQKTAMVSFTHDATGQTTSPFTFYVTGLGVDPKPKLEVREGSPSGGVISHQQTAVGSAREFGQRAVSAGPTAYVQIYILNPGTATMTLGDPTLNGGTPGEFVLDLAGYLKSVSAGGSTSFKVAFDPTSVGNKWTNVQVTHNDTTVASPFVFEVTGQGLAPLIQVREGSLYGAILASDAAAAGYRYFGLVPIAVMPLAKTWHILNTGNASLSLSGLTITGTNAADWNASFSATTVPAGSAIVLTIEFDASQVGVKDAQVSFQHDDTLATSPFLINIKGEADDPAGVKITTTSLPAGSYGSQYDAVLDATGGTGPYTWTLLTASGMPKGLALDPIGVITGVPNGNGGNFSLKFRVTDANGGTNDKVLVLSIAAPLSESFKQWGGKSNCSATGGSGAPWSVIVIASLAGLACLRRRRSSKT